jgi:hypothetical protein
VALTNGTWSAFTAAADLGAGFTISGLAYYQDDLLIMLSSGQDIRKFNTATNAITTWRTGEKGQVGIGYAGQLIYAPRLANNQEELRLSGTKWNGNAVTHLRYLDSPILSMALFNGQVAIATRTSLYFMGGQPFPGEADDASVTADTSKAPEWRGEPEPVMTHGQYAAEDDFIFLSSYRGRLYTWLRGRVAEFDDSQEEARWQRIGPEGVACHGATVAGDWLIVAITSRYGTNRQLWGFDGRGWWLLHSDATLHLWPMAVGGAGNRDLLVFRDASETYDLYRLAYRSSSVHSLNTGGVWTSSLIDAGDPSRMKAWRAIGATFAAPAQRGNAGSADAVTVTLEYSLNAGASWSQAASLAANDPATLERELRSAFLISPQSRYLQLRVVWSSVSDWAPVLASVWADYQVRADSSTRKRRWELAVDAGDRGVRRDGQRDSRPGRQQISRLWTAWEGATSLVFRDIDDDTRMWTPALLGSQLQCFIDPSASEGLEDGAAVDLGRDISGYERHAHNPVANQRPTFKTGIVGGRPVFRFNGTSHELLIDNPPLEQPFWTFLVLQTAAAGGHIYNASAATLLARLGGAAGENVVVNAGAGNMSFAGPSLDDDLWHMLFVQHNGVSTYVAQDGTADAPQNAGANEATTGQLRLFSAGDVAWLSGDLGAFLIGSGVATSATVDLLFGWGAHWFGLAGNLPALHPYKSAAPEAHGSYEVFIDEIEERAGRPADQGRWGESRVLLKLSEV